MRSCRLTSLTCALAVVWGLGCNPVHRILSKCNPDAGECSLEPPAPVPPKCVLSDECGEGEECVGGLCVGCSALLKPCDDCPDDQTQFKYQEGRCTACKCVPKCQWHEQCAEGTICVNGGCTECPLADLGCTANCNWGWTLMRTKRNGCEVCECTPPNECLKDADCGAGQLCHVGQQCLEGCFEPACCFGNLCSPAECKPSVEADCVYVGCARGVCRGDPQCPLTGCRCDPRALEPWACPNTCFAQCDGN